MRSPLSTSLNSPSPPTATMLRVGGREGRRGGGEEGRRGRREGRRGGGEEGRRGRREGRRGRGGGEGEGGREGRINNVFLFSQLYLTRHIEPGPEIGFVLWHGIDAG